MKNRIKECRDRMKYTQDDFASKVGVSRSTIVQYEQGKIDIPSSKLLHMAEILKVTVDYLLGLDDSPQPYTVEEKNILKEPSTEYFGRIKVSGENIEKELEHLREINFRLEKHNEDQGLLIDLLMGRENLPKKVPRKVTDRLTRHDRSAS